MEVLYATDGSEPATAVGALLEKPDEIFALAAAGSREPRSMRRTLLSSVSDSCLRHSHADLTGHLRAS